MLIKLTQTKLLKVISAYQNLCDTAQMILHIEAKKQELIFFSTDHNLFLEAKLDIPVSQEGSVQIHFERFNNALISFPVKNIILRSEESFLFIENQDDNQTYIKLALHYDHSLPPFPQCDVVNFLNISSSLIKKLIDKTFFCLPKGDTKTNDELYTQNILFEKKENSLIAVSTDATRLIYQEEKLEIDPFTMEDFHFMLNKKLLKILKQLSEKGDQFTLRKKGKYLYLDIAYYRLYCAIAEEGYPDYKKVLSTGSSSQSDIQNTSSPYECKVNLKALDLETNINHVSSILKDTSEVKILLCFEANQFILKSQYRGEAEGGTKIPIDIDIDTEFIISVNYHFLLESIKHLSFQKQESTLVFSFNLNKNSPFRIHNLKEPQSFHTIMPMES